MSEYLLVHIITQGVQAKNPQAQISNTNSVSNGAATSSNSAGSNKYQHLYDNMTDEECAKALKTYFIVLDRAKDIDTETKDKVNGLSFKLRCKKISSVEFIDELNALLPNTGYRIPKQDLVPFFKRTLPHYRLLFPITSKCKAFKDINSSIQKMVEHQNALSQSNKELAKKIWSLQNSTKFPGSKKEEEALVLTFGLDESSLALRQFIDHYQLAKEVNMNNKIAGWNDSTFRAFKLCFQLRNDAASWVFKEMCIRKGSALHDEEILAMLREKYSDEYSIEEKIIRFEQIEQTQGESLVEYMQRCQNYGELAYSGFGEKLVQQRVIWKFMTGISNVHVRSALLASKWMLHQSEAKPCSQILQLAEIESEKIELDVWRAREGSESSTETKQSPLKRKRVPSHENDDSPKITPLLISDDNDV